MRLPWKPKPKPKRKSSTRSTSPRFTFTERRARATDFMADLLDLVDETVLEDALVGLVRRAEEFDAVIEPQEPQKPEIAREMLFEEIEGVPAPPDVPVTEPERPSVHSNSQAASVLPDAPEVLSGPKPDAHTGEETEAMIQKREELRRKRAGGDGAGGDEGFMETAPEERFAPRESVLASPFGLPPIVSLEEINRERRGG